MKTTTSSRISKRTFGLLIAAGLSQMIVVIDYMAVAVAMPEMAKGFGVQAVDLQWVLTGYILSFSVMLGIAGPLGDRYGRKRLLLLGITLFGLTSLWVGFANSATMVIIARVVLGIGGGMLMPLSIAVVSAGETDKTLPRTLAILTGVGTIGMAIGPVVGGVFTDELTWRWIFWMNAPIAALAFAAVALLAEESKDEESSGPIDLLGMALLIPTIALLAFGVDRIPHWPTLGWAGLLGGGVITGILFFVVEHRQANPIIDLKLLLNRTFAGYTLAGTLANSTWCVLIFALTMHLQTVAHDTAMQTGLIFLFMSSTVAIASFTAPVIQPKLGTKNMVVLALAIQAVASIIFWISDSDVMIIVGMLIGGFGCAWTWSMTQAGGIATVPRNKVGLASGTMLTVMVTVGNMAVVVSATLISALAGSGEARNEPGIHASFLLAIGLVLTGLVLTWLLVPRSATSHSA